MNQTFIRFPDFKLKALTFSYDDGVRQDKRLIKIFKKYGLKGTFNISAGLFTDKYEGVEDGIMSLPEALELYTDSGMEIAAHGYKHLDLTMVDGAVATNDVLMGRKELENIFGGVIKGMAYAYGSFNDKVVQSLKDCGVNYCRTTEATDSFVISNDWLRLPATCHHNSPKLMELAKEFVEITEVPRYWSNYPRLFYVWGHSYEFDRNNNWSVIEDLAAYISGKDDIWYATNGEIFEYLQACERLEWSVDASSVRNVSHLTVYIDYFGTKAAIEPGQTVILKS